MGGQYSRQVNETVASSVTGRGVASGPASQNGRVAIGRSRRRSPWLFALVIPVLGEACGSDPSGPGGPQPDAAVATDDDLRADADAAESALDGQTQSDASAEAADADAAIPTFVGTHLWSKRFGSLGSAVNARVAVDALGDVYIAGSISGSADLGGGTLASAGASDVLIAKFDRNGNHKWSKRFGDAAVQSASAIAVDSVGSVFLAGGNLGAVDFGGGSIATAGGADHFVAKFDANGNHVWSKGFGDTAQQLNAQLALVGGDVVLLGLNSGVVDFGGGATNASNYIVRLSGADGSHIWTQTPVSGGFVPSAIATNTSGAIVATGWLTQAIALDWGGGVLSSAGAEDIVLLKWNSAGALSWSKRFGGTLAQTAADVAVDAAGRVALTGAFSGALDFGAGAMNRLGAGTVYVAVLDAAGIGVWSKQFPTDGSAGARGESVAFDPFGNVAVTGENSGVLDFGGGPLPSSAGASNMFLAKLGPDGKHRWSRGWPGGDTPKQVLGTDVTFDSEGNLFIRAQLAANTIDVGGGPLTAMGSDTILAKLAP